ncbi:hypothetical protein [Streptomyces sp. PanSC9]|uniref:hypothetical protein n=1 Tax=Streptomyces sp. PanSC9 TaxID=1520461 RepID=UPI000F475146|nr:hypothetical protein [Streptomyces sp. PanSC9]ROP55739.1 hypothetical protein EDD94_5309 [Streptomyces sp. PanSC9]
MHLGISGVEAQAQLKVRLDNVAAIIDQVLTTLDRDPELLPEPARGVGSAVRDVGGGARHAVGELGAGTGRAVRDVGRGVGAVAEDVGESAAPLSRTSAGGARRVVEDVGGEAGPAVVKAGQKVGHATGSVTEKPAEVAGTTGGAAEGEPGGDTVRKGAKAAAGTASEAPGTKRPARSEGRGVARRPAAGDRDRPARSPSGTRTRRVRDEGREAATMAQPPPYAAGARRAALNGGCGQTRPGTAFRFPGSGERQSTSHSDRTSLPDKGVPGREYHDTTVTYRLATRLDGEPR